MELARQEKCEFLPFMLPKEVFVKSGRITGMEFVKMEQELDGSWHEDPEQTLKIKAGYIISAFGSSLFDKDGTVTTVMVLKGKYTVRYCNCNCMVTVKLYL